MTASVLKQDPKTQKIQKNVYLLWHGQHDDKIMYVWWGVCVGGGGWGGGEANPQPLFWSQVWHCTTACMCIHVKNNLKKKKKNLKQEWQLAFLNKT